jgi:large subunit ribosomal protein L18Ae
MVKQACQNNNTERGRQFYVYGRQSPCEAQAEPEITVMKIIAKNSAFAKSKFWKIMRSQNKIKKSHGEILKVQEVFNSGKVQAQNFGIYLKYQSHVGKQNMFKEFRAVSVQDAVDQLYNEMGGNYKVSRDRIDIVKVVKLSDENLRIKNPRCLQFQNTNEIAIPVWKKNFRPSLPQHKTSFVKKRPCTYKSGVSVDI